MQEITTMFTAIGDFFTKADWYTMVKWPFWILLCTVATGGVYCARFGKKTLINQGISGVLNLVVIYLTAAVCFSIFPPLRTSFPTLPFLTATENAAILVDPFILDWSVLAPFLLQLLLMSLFVSLSNSFISGGKTFLGRFFSQIIAAVAGFLLYTVFTAGLSMILPAVLGRYAIIPVVIVLATTVLLLSAKFIFTVLKHTTNSYFKAVNNFFTVNKAGALFSTSILTFLLSMALLITMHLCGKATMVYASANTSGLCVILFMLLLVLYIFSMFNTDKKKS